MNFFTMRLPDTRVPLQLDTAWSLPLFSYTVAHYTILYEIITSLQLFVCFFIKRSPCNIHYYY